MNEEFATSPEKKEEDSGVTTTPLLSSEDWLKEKFPLLHADEFTSVFFARLKDLYPDFKPLEGEERFVLHVRPGDPLYEEMRAELKKEFEALVELSLELAHSGEPPAARSALCYIISSGGEPLIVDERSNAICAALRCFNLWSQRLELRVDSFPLLSWLLGFGGDLAVESRMQLLDSLELFLREGNLPTQDVADCLRNGLQLELRQFRQMENRKPLILRWVHLCARYAPPVLCVLLDVTHDTTDDIDIKQAAKAAAYDLRGSVRRLWDDTLIDQVATLESRAQRIQQGLHRNYGDAELAQHVISQCKGEPLVQDDPRLVWLLDAMTAGNERVRLAAARCLTECRDISEPLSATQEALHGVAEILVNSGDSRYVSDAMWILDSFKSANPNAVSYVDAAISHATAKFLQ